MQLSPPEDERSSARNM